MRNRIFREGCQLPFANVNHLALIMPCVGLLVKVDSIVRLK